MKFKDNPEYSEVFCLTQEGQLPIRFYVPADISTGYHISRFSAAQAQNIYASSGATVDILNSLMDSIILICNDVKKTNPTLRTDVAALANQVKYRTKYPVDEDCCLRMAAIYTFIEGEDPNKVSNVEINKKVALAKDNPALYTFFLHMGLIYTPAYRQLSEVLKDLDYFQKRAEAMKSLIPIQ